MPRAPRRESKTILSLSPACYAAVMPIREMPDVYCTTHFRCPKIRPQLRQTHLSAPRRRSGARLYLRLRRALPLAPPTAVWLLLAFHGFLWPHLAYRLACRAKEPFKAEIRNLLIDSAFGGFWAAMMAFNALPAIVILSMMSMNNIASAGKALFVKGLAIQLTTAMLTAALLGFPFHPHSTALQIYLCLPMIYLYPTLLGLVTYRTAKRLAEKKQELQRISTRDGLTGLYNRRHWEHLLHRQFDSCRRYQDNATLILMDIDRFKTINDTFGHALGDEALAALAEELLIGMRNVDIVGRYGGDEFGAVLPNTSAEQAGIVLRRIQQRLDAVSFKEAPQLRLQISAGIADYHPRWAAILTG